MEEIRIEDLKPAEGATKKRKRVGRGRASGHGKTSCRGHNGEGQRSGNSRKIGFEGGQMPGYRKTPKLDGFDSHSPIVYAEISIAKLAKIGEAEVDIEFLKSKGYFTKKYDELRVLGSGEISQKITVKARHFTKSAKEKIEAAGGKAVLV